VRIFMATSKKISTYAKLFSNFIETFYF